MGSACGSETTAAAIGQAGVLRRDPFAMLPFCGYNMGDYFAHWLKMGKSVHHAPRIFRVNWFRKDANGKYIWPGFGENMRVLEWIVGRCHDLVKGMETPLGIIPAFEDLNWRGLEKFTREQYQEISRVDGGAWKDEVASHDELLVKLGAQLPRELAQRRTQLHQKLAA